MNIINIYIGVVVALIITFIIFLRWIFVRTIRIRERLQMSLIFTNITHELLTPLTILSASIENLRNSNPTAHHEYDLMDLNIQRSVRLLQQILETSMSQAGKLELRVSNGDVMQYIRETAHCIEPLMEKKQVDFLIQCKPDSMMGWIDTDKLDKIIFNLLSNAVKYAGDKAKVILDVTTNQRYDHVIIRVSDNGPGIPKDKMKHIFTRFNDGDYRNNQTFGTELGLSLTYDLVRLHKGTIQCKSIDGQGTTFLLELPINKEAFSAAQIDDKHQIKIPQQLILDLPTPEATIPQAIQTSPVNEDASRILLVVDNQELLMLMKQLLQSKYHVLTATNGREALQVVHAHPVDLIISDVMMSDINGYELTSALKQDENFDHLPIILITAKLNDEERMEALTAGADDIIAKPFKMRELQLRIDNIIANRQRVHADITPVTSNTTDSVVHKIQSADQEYLQRAIRCINEHISDSDYDRDAFAADMSNSVSTLYNKIRAITGKNVTTFVRDIRIKTACRLAKEDPNLRVSDIAYQVGFKDPKYFATSFKRVMGMQPKEYFDHLRGEDSEMQQVPQT